ncbi:MAG: manganese efflux pump [Lachnospiraceae bacterium]|nr:manganese efflux pump [Lachnospiraceae bacterium]
MNEFAMTAVSVGLSLDVFAVVVWYGSVLLKIERSRLVSMAAIFCVWQGIAVVGGNYLALIPGISSVVGKIQFLGVLLCVLAFLGLGAFMVFKGFRNRKNIKEERLQDVKYRAAFLAAILTSIDAFIAGLGFGFIGADIIFVLIAVIIITALMVILGLYIGYRIGVDNKYSVYNISAGLMVFSAVTVIINYLK